MFHFPLMVTLSINSAFLSLKRVKNGMGVASMVKTYFPLDSCV